MKKRNAGLLIFALACVGLLVMASMASAAVTKVICVPWQGNPNLPHTALSGQQAKIKAVVYGDSGTAFNYTVDFGDASPAGAGSGVIGATGIYNLEVTHTYSAGLGTPFTATVTIDGAGLSDQYKLRIEQDNLSYRVNIAIDNGLWRLHKVQTRGTYAAGTYGPDPVPYGYWSNAGAGGYSGYYSSPTASAIQAFEVNGHRQTGSVDEDPYVETVGRSFNYMFTTLYVQGIGGQAGGHPEDYNNDGDPTNDGGNRLGISVSSNRPIYETGQVMDAIAASGTPLTTAKTGPANVIGRTYKEILQDMVDMYSWGQYDSSASFLNRDLGVYQTGIIGGWRYSWGDWPDNSAAQWGAIGIIPAEDLFGCQCPAWVKSCNSNWLWRSNDGTGFGYTDAGNGQATTPSGLVQMAFAGLTTSQSRWTKAENYIANNWSNWFLPNTNYYAWYAFTKAMRLALPNPVVNLSATGLDWYGDANTGLAQKLVGLQSADGSWPSVSANPWIGEHLGDAWSIIILKGLFQLQPVAVATAAPNPTGLNIPVTLDGSGSYHMDPSRQILSYAWDFDAADGIDWNNPDATGVTATTSFGAYDNYTVTLRVIDDTSPTPQTAVGTVTVRVEPPPHDPTAVSGGPYVACSEKPVTLNGSGSFDIDEPEGDYIVSWGWELDGAVPYDYDDASGETVQWTWNTPGTYDIALKVTDSVGRTNIAWTKVEIAVCPEQVCDVNKDGKVDIYDIQLIGKARGTTNTLYDIDKDGLVTTNDARQCVIKCDNPRCAP